MQCYDNNYDIFVDHKWPRLFLCNKQHKNVKYDPDHLEIKTLEPIIAGIIIYKFINKIVFFFLIFIIFFFFQCSITSK